MSDETSFDLTGPVVLQEREQFERAPLTPLELSRTDAVADYFRQRGSEPSYEEIARMALPYKYVNARFQVYPLVLGDKNGLAKVRMLSNAAELHLGIAEAGDGAGVDSKDHWFGASQRVIFSVGEGASPQEAAPRWRDGYLPVAEFGWEQDGAHYTLEAFATLLPDTTTHLCAWIRIAARRLRADSNVAFHASFKGQVPLTSGSGYLMGEEPDRKLLCAGYSPGWEFDAATQTLVWRLSDDEQSGEACLIVMNEPAPNGLLLEWPATRPHGWAIDMQRSTAESSAWLAEWAEPMRWQKARDTYCQSWEAELAAGSQVQTPEPIVEAAHRSVRISSQIIATRNQMSYSVHNQYERIFTDESSQAAIGLAYWGHLSDAARYLGQLSFYTQNGLQSHELGLRLHWFCRYISLSDDAEFLDRNARRMRRWACQLMDDVRDEHHGLAPPNHHSGDLPHLVYSLSANGVAWRGVRDFALLSGDEELAARASRYRENIQMAAVASLDRSVDPPFLPVSLYGDEPTPDALTATTLGSYWCLMAPYALYSGVLGDQHPGTKAIIDTLKQRGGLCAGLVRWTAHPDYSIVTSLTEAGLDDLYGAKLAEVFARLDDPEQLVLTLYGKLGLGLTRDTFIGGEISSLVPSRIFGDNSSDGRSLYLPPNSASHMMFASLLRHCLVLDFDSHNDGRFDTLRLAFSTPRRWLAGGKRLSVKSMPTAFGAVSYEIISNIDQARTIDVVVDMPTRRQPDHVYLRLRVPIDSRQTLQAVSIDDQSHHEFNAVTETIDLSHFSGRVRIRAEYG